MKTSIFTPLIFASILLFGAACGDSADNNAPNDGAPNNDVASNDAANNDAANNDAANSDAANSDAANSDAANSDVANSDTANNDVANSDAGETNNDMSGADGPEPVNLGAAGDYVILAKTGISTTGATAVVGDIGLSPADATYITGFGLNAPPTTHTTSALVTGEVYAADYDEPTPTNLTTAVSAMETAYTDAAGRTLPDFTELGAGNIDGLTLVPGLYKWGTGVTIPTGVTLNGDSNDVWIFQIGQDLNVGNGAIVTLAGGAQAKNVFWQVAGQTTLGTTSDFSGILLVQTLIEINTGAAVLGRALAQTAVTLDATAITQP